MTVVARLDDKPCCRATRDQTHMVGPDHQRPDRWPMGIGPVASPAPGLVESPVSDPEVMTHPKPAPGARARVMPGFGPGIVTICVKCPSVTLDSVFLFPASHAPRIVVDALADRLGVMAGQFAGFRSRTCADKRKHSHAQGA